MKKIKFYLGKNKVKHRFGRQGSVWVVPRLLRNHFREMYSLHLCEQRSKMFINSSFGIPRNPNKVYGRMSNKGTCLTDLCLTGKNVDFALVCGDELGVDELAYQETSERLHEFVEKNLAERKAIKQEILAKTPSTHQNK